VTGCGVSPESIFCIFLMWGYVSHRSCAKDNSYFISKFKTATWKGAR